VVPLECGGWSLGCDGGRPVRLSDSLVEDRDRLADGVDSASEASDAVLTLLLDVSADGFGLAQACVDQLPCEVIGSSPAVLAEKRSDLTRTVHGRLLKSLGGGQRGEE